jgi:hypothetical protein
VKHPPSHHCLSATPTCVLGYSATCYAAFWLTAHTGSQHSQAWFTTPSATSSNCVSHKHQHPGTCTSFTPWHMHMHIIHLNRCQAASRRAQWGMACTATVKEILHDQGQEVTTTTTTSTPLRPHAAARAAGPALATVGMLAAQLPRQQQNSLTWAGRGSPPCYAGRPRGP